MNIRIKHDLDNKFACRKDGSACSYHKNEEIYVFQIIDIDIKEHSSRYTINIRGEHTCWMNIDNFYISNDPSEYDHFIEQKRKERLVNSCYKTYDTREM